MCLFIRENPALGGSRAGHVLARLPWKLFTFIELFICAVHLQHPPQAHDCDTQTHGQRGHEPLHTWTVLPKSHQRQDKAETLGQRPWLPFPLSYRGQQSYSDFVCSLFLLQSARVQASSFPLLLFLKLKNGNRRCLPHRVVITC